METKVLVIMHVSKLFMMILEITVNRHFAMIGDGWKVYVGEY